MLCFESCQFVVSELSRAARITSRRVILILASDSVSVNSTNISKNIETYSALPAASLLFQSLSKAARAELHCRQEPFWSEFWEILQNCFNRGRFCFTLISGLSVPTGGGHFCYYAVWCREVSNYSVTCSCSC